MLKRLVIALAAVAAIGVFSPSLALARGGGFHGGGFGGGGFHGGTRSRPLWVALAAGQCLRMSEVQKK
jgi:uncharacterized membrane protein